MTSVLCVGSGFGMEGVNDLDIPEWVQVVGVNNVWKGTDKWDYLIHSGDYPESSNINPKAHQEVHSREGKMGFKQSYVGMSRLDDPNMEWKDARIYLGLPIYFTATYWAMWHLKPKYIACLGFDMDYTAREDGSTAFYGKGLDFKKRGMPDPEYQFSQVDEYKAMSDPMLELQLRQKGLAKKIGCELFNLSENENTKLIWEKIKYSTFRGLL